MGEHPIGNLYDEKSNDAVDIVMKLNDAVIKHQLQDVLLM